MYSTRGVFVVVLILLAPFATGAFAQAADEEAYKKLEAVLTPLLVVAQRESDAATDRSACLVPEAAKAFHAHLVTGYKTRIAACSPMYTAQRFQEFLPKAQQNLCRVLEHLNGRPDFPETIKLWNSEVSPAWQTLNKAVYAGFGRRYSRTQQREQKFDELYKNSGADAP